jgi:hypothetical protein
MSTDTRGGRRRRRRGRSFVLAFALVFGVLVVAGGAGAAVTVSQGPRVTGVQVDPAAAVAASGARVIVTTTQALQKVDASQVEVDPATPFTVDTSGRSVGLRFTLPLQDDADYTVRIRDVQGVGGGPTGQLEERFRTPPLQTYLLQRGGGQGDTILRTGLDGEATPVFSDAHIEDFRVTASHLVVSVLDGDTAQLIATDLDGSDPRELPLPGDGFVSNLQAADRGERIGYTFSDASLGASGGRESVLFTTSLAAGAADPPTEIALPGDEARVAEWRFVPDTDSILALTFDGRLLLAAGDGSNASPLGNALGIEGIARGSSQAVVERLEGRQVIDLADGTDAPLVDATGEDGVPSAVTPVPGDAAGTLRTFAEVSATSTVLGTRIAHVADDGTVSTLLDVGPDVGVLQTCASPSGRYAAVLLAPDAAANPYDRYRLPVPERVETRIIEIATGQEVVGFGGFDLSWCQVAPS